VVAYPIGAKVGVASDAKQLFGPAELYGNDFPDEHTPQSDDPLRLVDYQVIVRAGSRVLSPEESFKVIADSRQAAETPQALRFDGPHNRSTFWELVTSADSQGSRLCGHTTAWPDDRRAQVAGGRFESRRGVEPNVGARRRGFSSTEVRT
jgi:hypothetical protein